MSVWNDSKIGDWTPTQLAKFVQETIASDPPPLPPQITLDSLSVIGDTEIGGQLSVQGIAELLGKTTITPPISYLTNDSASNQTFASGTDEIVSFNKVVYHSGGIGAHTSGNSIKILSQGFYVIGAEIQWASNGSGDRRLWIESADGTFTYARDNRRAATSSHNTTNRVITVNYFSKSISFKAKANQDSGGSLDMLRNSQSPLLWAVKLGPA